jgi:two-component system sensor histidine kinase EvgS
MAGAAPRAIAHAGNAATHRALDLAGRRFTAGLLEPPPDAVGLDVTRRQHRLGSPGDRVLAILPATDPQALQPEAFHRPSYLLAGLPLRAWLMWTVSLLVLTSVALGAAIVALRRRGRHLARATRTLQVCMAFDAAMFEGMPDPVYLCDGSARLIGCNTAYEQFFGARRDQLLGKTLNQPDGQPAAIPAEVAMAIRHAYQQLLASRQPIRCRHSWHAGDREIRVRHWARPLLAADGGVAGLMGGFVDISPTAEGARDAEGTHAAKAAPSTDPSTQASVLATMSHEIRTPMQAVIGILDMLLRQNGIRGKARRHLATAHGAARSLLALLDDLLHMSSAGAGGMDIRPEPVHIGSLLRESMRMYGPMATRKGLRLKLHTAPLRQRHRADPARVRQILANLIGNAIKFSEQGEISILLERCGESPRGDLFKLTVRDQGVGIDRAELPRLFEPFFRARTACGIPGTGLGLPMSRQLARQMGGDLDVDSEPGIGTVVTLTMALPRVAGTECDRIATNSMDRLHRPPPRVGRRRTLPAGSYHVLVVDDHDVCRLLLARQLDHLGHQVIWADNGAQGLAMAESRRADFDVAVIDCNMPVMDGFEAARRWRALERTNQWPRKPLIGYSADPTPENRARAIDAGMDACLVKPAEINVLGNLLVSLVSASVRAAQSDGADIPGVLGCKGGDRLLELLQSTNASDLCAMQCALRNGDWSAFGTALHRIKGAARMALCDRVSQCCDTLEAALHARDSAAMTAGVAQLSQALHVWTEELSHLRRGGGDERPAAP